MTLLRYRLVQMNSARDCQVHGSQKGCKDSVDACVIEGHLRRMDGHMRVFEILVKHCHDTREDEEVRGQLMRLDEQRQKVQIHGISARSCLSLLRNVEFSGNRRNNTHFETGSSDFLCGTCQVENGPSNKTPLSPLW